MKTEPMPEPVPSPQPHHSWWAALRNIFQRSPAEDDADPAETLPTTTRAPTASSARTPLDYRVDGARHLYEHNPERIFQGRLPPQLYAIGVLNVHINRRGRVTELDWLRAPTHAPEVVAEIERTVVESSPFPVPSQLGQVVYTDTWLWHESGHFQLDTLTEGQD